MEHFLLHARRIDQAAGKRSEVQPALAVDVAGAEDHRGGGRVQALLRFDLSAAAGCVPARATLRLYTMDPQGANDEVTGYRLNEAWDPKTTTWNSLGGGVQPPRRAATPSFAFTRTKHWTFASADVSEDVEAWLSPGALNAGLVLTTTSNNGFDFATSENGQAVLRPTLEVSFRAADAEDLLCDSAQPWVLNSGTAWWQFQECAAMIEPLLNPESPRVDELKEKHQNELAEINGTAKTAISSSSCKFFVAYCKARPSWRTAAKTTSRSLRRPSAT